MIDHRCKRCLYWDNEHPYVKTVPVQMEKKDPGICRKGHPGAHKIGDYYYGVQVIMDANEFCGGFKPDVNKGGD